MFRKIFRSATFILFLIVFLFNFGTVFAQETKEEYAKYLDTSADKIKNNYEQAVEKRYDALPLKDFRREEAEKLKDNAEDAAEYLVSLDAFQYIEGTGTNGNQPPFTIMDEYKDAEESALRAINEFNRYMLVPKRPGNVPKGDIISDFIPQFIRILMRFVSLAILAAFLYSGFIYITAHGDDEKLTKAKTMLYYSLIGFAFVVLAYAIITAVTDINFFGQAG